MGRPSVQDAPVQGEVLEAIRSCESPMQPKEIVEATGRSRDSVNSALKKLKERGQLVQPAYGKYDLPERVQSLDAHEVETKTDDSESDKTISYPLSRAGAGPGRTSQNDRIAVDPRIIESEVGSVPDTDQAFWLRVEGESMEPWLRDGSFAFAIRQSVVDVPGRYVVWWGAEQAQVCCYLAKMSDEALLLRKYSPETEFELRHQEGEMYETPNGDSVQVQVRGRIIYPPATAKSVMDTVTDKMGEVLQKALQT